MKTKTSVATQTEPDAQRERMYQEIWNLKREQQQFGQRAYNLLLKRYQKLQVDARKLKQDVRYLKRPPVLAAIPENQIGVIPTW